MAARPKGQGARAMLREMVLSGRFSSGTYLPPVRELAKELEIPKSTVHNILSMLQQEGLVQIQPRRRGVLVLDSSARKKVLKRIYVRASDFGYFGASPESSRMLAGLCAAAEKRYMEILITFADSLKFIDEMLELYRNGTIQGVVYMECGDPELIKPLEDANIPYIVMDDDPTGIDCVKCVQNFREIARQAVYYLHRAGHKKIGMLYGEPSQYLYSEMLAGFRGALTEENLECNPDWMIKTGNQPGDDIKNLSRLLKSKDRPTAFFTARDYRAKALYEICENENINIPGDLSVISYDDINWPEGPGRGLTTFREPTEEIGEQAVAMLQEWISSEKKPGNREIKSPLIERKSIARI